MDRAVREDARRRLATIRGHLEGVLRQLDDEQIYCVDVLQQLYAVRSAVDKVGEVILRGHLQEHVVTASERGDSQRLVDELMELLKYHRP
jgi:DNA-binding FrmR family transcriptional regulator